MAAIFKFLSDAATYFHVIVEGDREIAQIEQVVKIGSKKDPIPNLVRAIFCVRANVAGFQCRKRPLSGYGAASRVGVGSLHAKSSLPEPRTNRHWLAVPCLLFGNCGNRRRLVAP